MQRAILLTVALAALLPVGVASAVIQSISAEAEVSLTEFVNDSQTANSSEAGFFPSSDQTLPLQVITERLSEDERAAGVVAVQFADPAAVDTENPQEFAVNLALTSESDTTRYTSSGSITETRSIVFNPGEIANTAAGDTLELVGTLFLDGTLSLLTADADRDISTMSATVNITVTKVPVDDPNAESSVVFSGGLSFTGTSDGNATAEVSGDFPTEGILVTDLSALLTEFDGASVLILPQIEVDYAYEAIVGQAFELVAKLEVSAENLADETAALILLGVPLDQLATVIGQVQDTVSAKQLIDALEAKRVQPEGTPAFTAQPTVMPGLCGLLGFSSLLGLATLSWRSRRAA